MSDRETIEVLRAFCLQKTGVNGSSYSTVVVPAGLFIRMTTPMVQGIQLKECIVTFNIDRRKMVAGVPNRFNSEVYYPVLPRGLIIWGASDKTLIDIQIGAEVQAATSLYSIPAQYFSGNHTFEETLKLAEKGELSLSLEQRQILTMDVIYPGMRISVTIDGPFSNFCMWGVRPSGIPEPAYAEIKKIDEPASSEVGGHTGRTYYVGRIVRPTLLGTEYEQIRVEAPTSHDVAVVLAPALATAGIRGLAW